MLFLWKLNNKGRRYFKRNINNSGRRYTDCKTYQRLGNNRTFLDGAKELIKKIVIPNSVTIIEEGAFYNCTSLESIIIFESVSRIALFAFLGCDKLIIKCYSGSYAEQYAKRKHLSYEIIDWFKKSPLTDNQRWFFY